MKAKTLLICMLSVILFVPYSGITSYVMAETECFSGDFVRGKGKPVTETHTFSSTQGGLATLIVTNGGFENSEFERVSSAEIFLNNEQVCDPSDFNQNVGSFKKDIVLNQGDNTTAGEKPLPSSAFLL